MLVDYQLTNILLTMLVVFMYEFATDCNMPKKKGNYSS